MLKPRTIQAKLFLVYSLLIVGIILAFVTVYYVYNVKVLENKSSEAVHQLTDNISSQMDSKLKDMDAVSEKYLFSSTFSSITKIYPGLKSLFGSDLSKPSIDSLNVQRQFNDMLYTILGPQFPVQQINIYNTSTGYYIGAGNHTTFGPSSVPGIGKKEWVEESLKNDGSKVITPPHKDDWENTDNVVISLCRAFAPDWGSTVDTVIETQVNYDVFSGIIEKATSSFTDVPASERQVYVFDQSRQVIYPYPSEPAKIQNAIGYRDKLDIKGHPFGTGVYKNPDNGSRDIVTYSNSSFSGWTVMVIEPEKALLQPAIVFRNNTLAAGLIIILITLFVTFFVSRGLTTPIKRIHKSIKGLKLETLSSPVSSQIRSGLNELEELNLSYIEMCERLKVSLEEVVSSRSHEIQAQLLALQSQMNPHFLYNTLTTISIMAEDAGNANIVRTCENLSSMLRYISSDNTAPVTISQELDHTLSFLNLMEIRYEGNLFVEVDIPEEIRDVYVPKLVIEPLVENCTKYGINVTPPWKIRIEGRQKDNRWMISVRDNGMGFDNIEYIVGRLSSIDLRNSMPRLEVNGMGLVNIFTRLKLLYGDDTLFEIGNHPDGGAVVTIGGPIMKG